MIQEKVVLVSCVRKIEGMPFSGCAYVLTEKFLVFLLGHMVQKAIRTINCSRTDSESDGALEAMLEKGVPA